MKVAVLISGRGSNLKALLNACASPDFPAQIVSVVSDHADAGGLDHAKAFGVPYDTIERHAYPDKAAFEAALDGAIRSKGAELVCLAGFMRLLSADFLAGWGDRIINIHPSLLPAFRGLNTHERVIEAGVRISGCTVHVVRPAMDDGPILGQAAVPVFPNDTPDDLAGRVLLAEHRAYPLALRLLAQKRLQIEADTVTYAGRISPSDPNTGSILMVPPPEKIGADA
jgi:phosphoribosylglycinamide formyltransferase-1